MIHFLMFVERNIVAVFRRQTDRQIGDGQKLASYHSVQPY